MNLAWVLDFGAGRFAAVAHRQQLQLLHEPDVHALAFAPAHAPQVLIWGEHCVPVLDFGHWCGGAPTGGNGTLGLYAYMPANGGTHRLGALWLAAPPVVAKVDDERACELPAEREHWRGACLSCWEDRRRGAVPIIDLARVFEAGASDLSNRAWR
jgi:hypothetical protein